MNRGEGCRGGAGAVMPVWARMGVMAALSGLPSLVIRRLYNEGHVRARKVDAERANSATVYRVQDVLDWLENVAARPEKFKVPGEAGERKGWRE